MGGGIISGGPAGASQNVSGRGLATVPSARELTLRVEAIAAKTNPDHPKFIAVEAGRGEAINLAAPPVHGPLPYLVKIAPPFSRLYPAEASAMPAELSIISKLQTCDYHTRGAVPFEWASFTSGESAYILTKDGKWERLEDSSQLYDGALLSQGHFTSFNLTKIIASQVRLYRYESYGHHPLLLPFQYLGKNPHFEPLHAETILARQLGRSIHYIRRRYGETLKQMKAAGWSRLELKELAQALIDKETDVHRLDQTLEEIHRYTLTAKTRKWSRKHSKEFFLEFARNRALPLTLPQGFHRQLNQAVIMLASRGFTPEASTALLLHLAKHDPTLKAWEKLPEMLLGLLEIEASIGEHSREEDANVKLELDLALFREVLSRLAEREGEATAQAYGFLIAGFYNKASYAPNDSLKLIDQFLRDTVLPPSRIQDWVNLNDIQRRTFLTEVGISGEFLALFGLPPVLPPEILRPFSLFILDQIAKGEEIKAYTLGYDRLGNQVTLDLP